MNWSAAAESFAAVETEHPSKPPINERLCSVYEDGHYDQAIITLDRFIQLYPTNRDIAYDDYLKAMCYYILIPDVGRDQKNTELPKSGLEADPSASL
jgi:outer membrane protein assembly factor BamD